jgi:hypothetical protein
MLVKINRTLLITGLLSYAVISFSCSGEKTGNNQIPVAKVNDKVLYLSDLQHIFRNNQTKKDSAEFARAYIENWIKTQLLLKKAELNLTDEQQNISEQLEAYRSSLLIYKYQEQMVHEKVDTLITREAIEKYYNENSSNFLLHENLVKAIFIKVPLTAPQNDDLKKWYKSENKEDLTNLEKYCYAYANKYSDFDEDWISFADIQKQLPEAIANEDEFLINNRLIEKQDAQFLYLVKIKEIKMSGSIAPVGFVQLKIKDIILNKRKLEFISELEKNIYNDAADHSNFKIYNLDKK